MKYMLDTNICIFLINSKHPKIIQNLIKKNPQDICISSITYGELMYGVEKSLKVNQNKAALLAFLTNISIENFDDKAAVEYGQVRANLEKKGKPIGPLDVLIGAHAKSLKCTLVTNNTKEFERINLLKVEDWTK